MAADLAGIRPNPDGSCGGGGAGHRLARRKILTAPAIRFGNPPPGNAKAADGLAPATVAVAQRPDKHLQRSVVSTIRTIYGNAPQDAGGSYQMVFDRAGSMTFPVSH